MTPRKNLFHREVSQVKQEGVLVIATLTFSKGKVTVTPRKIMFHRKVSQVKLWGMPVTAVFWKKRKKVKVRFLHPNTVVSDDFKAMLRM